MAYGADFVKASRQGFTIGTARAYDTLIGNDIAQVACPRISDLHHGRIRIGSTFGVASTVSVAVPK
jgi:hypothetical protein